MNQKIPQKQIKHHKRSTKQKEFERQKAAEIYKEGFNDGYAAGLEEGLRRARSKSKSVQL